MKRPAFDGRVSHARNTNYLLLSLFALLVALCSARGADGALTPTTSAVALNNVQKSSAPLSSAAPAQQSLALQTAKPPAPQTASSQTSASVPCPSPASPALTDQEITQAILGDLIRAPDRSLVKKLKVQVRNGKVTLSGLIKNENQAKQIVAIAANAAGAANVEDKLEIRGKKRSS